MSRSTAAPTDGRARPIPPPPADFPKPARRAAEAAEAWEDEGPVRAIADRAAARASAAPVVADERPKRKPALPDEVVDELVRVVGSRRAPKLSERLDGARRSFERERYEEARRILNLLAKEAPSAAAVRELLGLTFYRLGKWRQAAAELEAFRTLTGSVEQHPVLADCYRALGRFHEVDALWSELREVSPSAELVAEGRIVAVGALADQGQLAAAISLMEKAPAVGSRLREHHLRQWYVLADLEDRAGNSTKATSLFRRIQQQSPGFADVDARLAALGR